MKLIADCGSSKCDWMLIDGTHRIAQVKTTGINALLLSEDEIFDIISSELLPHLGENQVNKIYYYGAGCIGGDTNCKVENALRRCFVEANAVEVESDLLAAARSVCGNRQGIACILGTGSNSCLYDGEQIIDHVPSLGYILGDEGSGATLGKLLVGEVLKRQLPADLCQRFHDEVKMDAGEIVNRVYKQPAANRFLASLSPFILANIEEPGIHRMVLNEFKQFFVRNVCNYAGFRDTPVHFVGSIALLYKSQLRQAAAALDIHIGAIVQSPIDGLVAYHQK